MPSQGREQKTASLQRKVGVGAKSLDRDLDNTIYLASLPLSHATVQWSGWVGAAKVQLYRYRCGICGCKINDLIKEETGTSILIYPQTPLGCPDPFALLDLFLLPYSAQSSAYPKLPWCFPILPVASDPLLLPKLRRMHIRY